MPYNQMQLKAVCLVSLILGKEAVRMRHAILMETRNTTDNENITTRQGAGAVAENASAPMSSMWSMASMPGAINSESTCSSSDYFAKDTSDEKKTYVDASAANLKDVANDYKAKCSADAGGSVNPLGEAKCALRIKDLTMCAQFLMKAQEDFHKAGKVALGPEQKTIVDEAFAALTSAAGKRGESARLLKDRVTHNIPGIVEDTTGTVSVYVGLLTDSMTGDEAAQKKAREGIASIPDTGDTLGDKDKAEAENAIAKTKAELGVMLSEKLKPTASSVLSQADDFDVSALVEAEDMADSLREGLPGWDSIKSFATKHPGLAVMGAICFMIFLFVTMSCTMLAGVLLVVLIYYLFKKWRGGGEKKAGETKADSLMQGGVGDVKMLEDVQEIDDKDAFGVHRLN